MAPVAPGAPLAPPAAPAMAPQPPAPPSPGEPLPGPAGPIERAPAGPRLVVVVGPTVGLSFALLGDSIRVGRDASNGIVLRDQTVSRQHAVLERRGDQWTVTDLGSTNGTEIGGQRSPPQQPTPLTPGSRVGFGDVECVFEVSCMALDYFTELQQEVEREVMACIGCNDCLLACPLPDKHFVTIAQLTRPR